MYRLIPFKNLSEIDDYYGSIKGLYKECLSSDSIYIQDTEDMVVEKFTLAELKDFEKNHGVAYEFFTTKCKDDFELGSMFLHIAHCNYLHDKITVSCDRSDSFNTYFDGALSEKPDTIGYKMKVTKLNKTFEITLAWYWWQSIDKAVSLLFVNNNPILVLDGEYLNTDFQLIQFCKKGKNFEFILSFTDLEIYFGVKLSNDLELIEFQNLEYFENLNLLGDLSDLSSIKYGLARRRLTGDWRGILC